MPRRGKVAESIAAESFLFAGINAEQLQKDYDEVVQMLARIEASPVPPGLEYEVEKRLDRLRDSIKNIEAMIGHARLKVEWERSKRWKNV